MKQTVNFYIFHDTFQHIRPDNFTYEGLKVLFDYLEEYEEATGSEIELDVIALCCDYAEESPQAIAQNYGIDLSGVDPEDPDSIFDIVEDWLNENTAYCGRTDDSIIYCKSF